VKIEVSNIKLRCKNIYDCSTEAMSQGKPLTPELRKKASILGWCIEWVFFSNEYYSDDGLGIG